MTESKDEPQPEGDDVEKEFEELIRDPTQGKRSLHELADTKAAEYRRRRELEEPDHRPEEDAGGEPNE